MAAGACVGCSAEIAYGGRGGPPVWCRACGREAQKCASAMRNDKVVSAAREVLTLGVTQAEVARRYGVEPSEVSRCLKLMRSARTS